MGLDSLLQENGVCSLHLFLFCSTFGTDFCNQFFSSFGTLGLRLTPTRRLKVREAAMVSPPVTLALTRLMAHPVLSRGKSKNQRIPGKQAESEKFWRENI